MDSGPGDFDLSAAWLRRAGADMKAFLEALATRLDTALPGRVAVARRRDGLFSKSSHVSRIALTFPACVLTLDADKGQVQARRSKVVRGVTIGSEEIDIPAWLAEVERQTRGEGAAADAAHGVLHDFLLS